MFYFPLGENVSFCTLSHDVNFTIFILLSEHITETKKKKTLGLIKKTIKNKSVWAHYSTRFIKYWLKQCLYWIGFLSRVLEVDSCKHDTWRQTSVQVKHDECQKFPLSVARAGRRRALAVCLRV